MQVNELSQGIHFEGIVSVKRTFLWGERKLVVYSDRLELSQVDRPNGHLTVIRVENLSLAPIINHHASYEFTVFASQGGYLQRVRMRTLQQSGIERVYQAIEKVKGLHVEQQRLSNADLKRARSGKGDKRDAASPITDRPRLDTAGAPHRNTHHTPPSAFDNPHMSVNVFVAGLVLWSVWLAPLLDSWLMTISIVTAVGVCIGFGLNFYKIEVPSIHLILAYTNEPAPLQASRKESSASSLASDAAAFAVLERSRSYIEKKDFHVNSIEELEVRSNSCRSSINEDGYSTPVPGSPEHGGSVNILFSESSKYLSSFASDLDYSTCYSIMFSMGETIIQLLQSQPSSVAPPTGLRLVAPFCVNRKIAIFPDDLECTKNEWSVIRDKGGLKVVTSKLCGAMTRWPVISSTGTIKAPVEAVYRSVSNPEIFKRVDEFGGDMRIVDYVELAAAVRDSPSIVDEVGSPTAASEDAKSVLVPNTCPFLVKYQEMKSVWPVQPRDYLAGQSGFDVSLDERVVGKFLLAKSLDPNPKDPYPTGHEGFVRGSLTASAFLIIENTHNPKHADLWTFLHCDMKGSLSGNGKIADFITQSQMPKFFNKLETVSIEISS